MTTRSATLLNLNGGGFRPRGRVDDVDDDELGVHRVLEAVRRLAQNLHQPEHPRAGALRSLDAWLRRPADTTLGRLPRRIARLGLGRRRAPRRRSPRACFWAPLRARRVFLAVVAVWMGLAAEAVAQGSTATDRAALEAVYRATGGDNWADNTNWLSDAPLEDWYGVEVDAQGRVSGLGLGGWDDTVRRHVGNGLNGTLPIELGTLSHLRWLRIVGNRELMGTIPVALGRLDNLEELVLDHNALIGPIPAELGNLIHLRYLALSSNALSGWIPIELGNLTRLTQLNLGWTMLSGPLPESLTRLSALEWLQLDGSGLCAPDTPAVRAWLATISDFTGAVCEESTTFLRVVTQPGLGRLDSVLAVADLDGDGRDDILAGGIIEYGSGATPAERFTKTTLRVFISAGDGGFRHAPELVEGTIEVRTPIVAADDFNGDGRADFAVFDWGVFVTGHVLGYGNPPQLFLSSRDGRLHPSDALAEAVRLEHERRPNPEYSGPADLHVKSATSGDIDGDGDIDLWVESSGGANVNSHFMVNNGDGTFTLDDARAPDVLLHNPPPEYWRHVGNDLVDLDNDGDLDLALGQLRHFDPLQINGFSIVLKNDGTGHYSRRLELPHPEFYGGYTSVQALTHFDVNGDGFQDLLLVHDRMDNTFPNVIYFTGRYIQVLTNRGGTSFDDETPTWMGDQSATTPERDTDGNRLHNRADPEMHDVDRDGCADVVMSRSAGPVRTESPLVYRNDGSGRFRAMSPVPFAGSDRHFGYNAVPADVNGDAGIDFVVPRQHSGPDERYGTADDFTLVTLLNTTPPGPIRCADPANRPPALAGALPNRTLAPDGTVNVDVSGAFADPDGDALTYTVSSSAPGVVTASAAGARVTLTAVVEGTAAIRVTATDPGRLSATQSFTVTVSTTVSAPFTDDPLQPGVTPVKAVHFTELRTWIDALRSAAGLLRFSWTDPVLRAGVTRVRRVHLLELRSALAETYRAVRRAAPRWTDAAPAVGTAPIRALHVTELRAAVRALE